MRAGAGGPLRGNRDFQLLWAGQAISVVGSRASAVAYPLLVLALTGSPALAGLVGFLATLPYILFQLPAGAIVDRVDRRRLMILCDAGRLLALGSIPLAGLLGLLSVAQLAAAAFVEGTLFVFFRLGEVTAIRNLVEVAERPAALAQNEARVRAASLLGPAVGGLLFGLGRTVPFLADALSYLASLVSLLLIRGRFAEERPPAGTRMLTEIREGVAWLWRQRYVRNVNLAASATNALFQVVNLVVIVAFQRRGAPPAVIGLVLAGFGLGGVLGSLAGGRIARRFPANAIVIGALWIWTPFSALVAFAAAPLLVAGLLACLSFVGAAWNIAGNLVYLRLVPDRLIGRVSGVGALTAFGALPLGQLLAGLLIQAWGPRTAELVAAGLMLLVAVLFTAAPSVRRGPDAEAGA